MVSSEKVMVHRSTGEWLRIPLVLAGLLLAFGGCKLMDPGILSPQETGLGSVTIRVQVVSPVIAALLSQEGADRSVGTRAYIAARRVDFVVRSAADLTEVDSWTDYPSVDSRYDPEPEVGARTLPAGNYILGAEVYNNPNDPSPSVAGSEAFTVVAGQAAGNNTVIVTCLPVSPIELAVGEAVSDEFTLPTPWYYDLASHLYSPGSEIWFDIVPSTEMVQIFVTPTEGSMAWPLVVVYDGAGLHVSSPNAGDGPGLALQFGVGTVPWSHYYVGVVDLASAEATPRGLTLSYAPAGNVAPEANASGPTQVQVNGTAWIYANASDPNAGQTLTFQWEVIAGPSAGLIANPSLANALFTPDVQGTYVLALTVTDDGDPALSTTDTLTILAGPNEPPYVSVPTELTLTFGIEDSIYAYANDDGQGLTYLWEIDPASTGLSGTNLASVTFTPDAIGVYTLTVTVTDDQAVPLSTTESCTVTVNTLVAAPISVTGTYVEHTLSVEQWYSFDALSGKSYEISWDDYWDGTGLYDAWVYVSAYDEALNMLFQGAALGFTYPRTVGPLAVDQTVYLRAEPGQPGTFALRVTELP